MRRLIAVCAVSFSLCVAPATATAKGASPPCGHMFAHGQAPVLAKDRSERLLCFRAYAVLHSGQTRTAVWSAEVLTRAAVAAARRLPRDSDFYEEERLPPEERATLADYGRASGFDRGHLAPSGDFGDKGSRAESFSLANVIPQHPVSNRRTWSHLETSARRLVRKVGTAYVVTGPAFIRNADSLRGRIRIPDYIWKAIYIPRVGAAAYMVRNDATPAYSAISIDELQRFTGIDPFPGLEKRMRLVALELPSPTPHPGERPGRRVNFAWLASPAAGYGGGGSAPD